MSLLAVEAVLRGAGPDEPRDVLGEVAVPIEERVCAERRDVLWEAHRRRPGHGLRPLRLGGVQV